ncbi:hypothetical protein LWI29_000534 [Acer saccharum]|uniref:DUF4378 domain-containing protein n=1 Tax=Acer saccharum TaxID=4024 RepID=A0AA39VKT2_ACESA|nr:hypothetical protein LWI29_000534 [Acer saccharum]KAK1561889.1 hypothetical protein Q3G72_002541 [Acer saccharum]
METIQRRRSKVTSGDLFHSVEPVCHRGSRRAQNLRNFPKLASDSSTCSSDTSDDDSLTFELGWSSSKRVGGTPVKKLLAEEMSKETESKRRSPSVIARLMGLDGLPPQQPTHKQQKRSVENYQQRTASVEKSKSSGTSSGRRSFRKSSKEEQEFKDVFEVLDASMVESGSNSLRETTNSNFTEAEMVFIRQKFMDAKRLSTDERLQDSKEFQDALEVLDSNKDLLLRFLQQPDPLFTKHLHDLGAPSQSRCGHISTTTSSHAQKYESSGLASKAERETPRKNYHKTSEKHHDSLPSNSYSRHAAPGLNKSTKVQLEGKEDPDVIPTRIVVLKPNIVKAPTAPRTVSSPGSSHACKSNCKKHIEPPGIKSRELELLGKKNIMDDVGISRHKSRESREIAKEITRKMRNSINNGSVNFSSSGFKGYAGDESSSNMSGSDSADELEVKTATSRDDFGRHYRVRSSSSRSTESSVSREAKKRLSERWKMTHKSQDLGEISRGSTLGEMLAIPDREVKSMDFDATIDEEGFGDKFDLNDRAAGWVEPLGISSRDGWKDGCDRKLSRSRSLPASSSFGSPKASMRCETLVDDRYMIPKDTVKRERKKAVKGNLHQREVLSCRNSRSSSKKSVSPRCKSREINDTSPDIFFTRHQVDNNFKEDDPFEQRFMLSEASPSIVTDTNSVPENVSDAAHENITMSTESLKPEPSTPLLATGDLDISSSKDSSEGQSKEAPLHHPVSELQSPASSKEADQPSPVSILETPFVDDLSCASECFESISADLHGLRMQLQLLKLGSESYNEGPMLVSSDEDVEERSIASVDEKSVLKAEENWESSYIADVLINSGFNNVNPDTFVTTCHSPECPVSPLVFEDLENKYSNLTSSSRLERKITFDCINVQLVEIHQQLADPHPWVRLGTSMRLPRWGKTGLHDMLQKSLTSHRLKKLNKDTAEEDENVLGREEQWLDIGNDIEVIGREIEGLLIDELVAKVVAM